MVSPAGFAACRKLVTPACVWMVLSVAFLGPLPNDIFGGTGQGEFILEGAAAHVDEVPVEGAAAHVARLRRAQVAGLRPNPCDWVFLARDPLIGDDLVCVTGDSADPGRRQVVASADMVREFARLPVDGGRLVMQPDRGNVLVNIETIAYVESGVQSFERALLGSPVMLRATPVEYRWDFGEGEPFTTTVPGAPFPEATVWYVYRRATAEGETRRIAVETTWAGSFSVAGGPWQPIEATVTTTSTTDPFTVITAHTHLTDGSEIGRR